MMKSLGVAAADENVFLFSKMVKKGFKPSLQTASSSDGSNFKILGEIPTIVDEKSGKEEIVKKCGNFRISRLNGKYFLVYKYFTRKDKYIIRGAVSDDLVKWKRLGKLSKIKELGTVVPNYKYKDNYVMYFGEKSIRVALSKNLKKWKVINQVLLGPRLDNFDNAPLEVGACKPTNEGISLIYSVKDGKNNYRSVGTALFDKNDPKRILMRPSRALWERRTRWKNKDASPIGIVNIGGKTISYWDVEDEGIKSVLLSDSEVKTVLERFDGNPIIQPIREHGWESVATFNPAAVYEDGKVHILYRSVGYESTSVLGYASSKDGLHIDERLPEPVFTHSFPKGHSLKRPKVKFSRFYSPIVGWRGGCEDPRITKIRDRFYMTFVSFDGITPPRVALTSIKVKDFLNKKWDWKRPVIISPPGVVDKNCVIFPEKVKGRYVIFHRIFPSILIDFVDDLDYDGKRWLRTQATIEPRVGAWDSRKLGAGPPPIKTKDGWLLLYHAVDDLDPMYRYRIGAMILDIKDPTKVLYRCKSPIFEPGDGDANIAYPCGAVVIKNKLFVYYGSADRAVKVATTDLDYLLDTLKESGEPKITSIHFLNL